MIFIEGEREEAESRELKTESCFLESPKIHLPASKQKARPCHSQKSSSERIFTKKFRLARVIVNADDIKKFLRS